jgi:TPP-dependent indolepyruvate ferredoxin oxidoreductase alpha subunit
MSGFQPHFGSTVNHRGKEVRRIVIDGLVHSFGAWVRRVTPYHLYEVKGALEDALEEPGISVVLSTGLAFSCLTAAGRESHLISILCARMGNGVADPCCALPTLVPREYTPESILL